MNTQTTVTGDLISVKNIVDSLQLTKTIKEARAKGITGTGPEIVELPVNKIDIDRIYQRHIYKGKIETYLQGQGFSETLARPIVAYQRPESAGGKIVGIEGQHTSVMAYICGGPDAIVRVELHQHEEGMTLEECQQKEAWHFNHLNTNRKNLSPIEILKSGLLFGDPAAVEFDKNLTQVGLHIEGLGDNGPFGYPVTNITRMKWAFSKYDMLYVTKASKFCVHIYQNYWDGKPVKDALVLGTTAIQKLIDELGGGLKATGLQTWMMEEFPKIKESTWLKNTGGSKGHIYFARKVVEIYNQDVNRGNLNFDAASIGDKLLDASGLSNPDS